MPGPHLTPRHRVEAAALRGLRALLRPLPLGLVALPGNLLGWVLFDVVRFKRRILLENLRLALGETVPAAERVRLARRCYRFFGGLICEVLSHPRIGRERLGDHVAFPNLPVLDEALAAGKGVVMVTGHYGNWELIGAGLVALGYDFAEYVGRQGNPAADATLNEVRRAMGIGTIGKGTASRGMLRTLRENGILGIVSDQHYSRKTHYIHFFGRRVSAAPGAAGMALRTGARVVFAASLPRGRFRYEVRFRPIPFAPTGESERDILRLAQRISDELEAVVRERPAYYFWLHRRWRPPPPHLRLSPVNEAFLADRERAAARESAP